MGTTRAETSWSPLCAWQSGSICIVIAEGVETKEQAEFLLSINCHYAQGYYYYRPMPMSQFKELLLNDKKVDYTGSCRKMGETFNLQELMHPDAMSDVLFDLYVRERRVDYSEDDAARLGLPCRMESVPGEIIKRKLAHQDDQKVFIQMYAAIFRGEPRAAWCV